MTEPKKNREEKERAGPNGPEMVDIMIKYELRENSREVKYKERFEITKGCTQFQESSEPVLIKTFGTKEEALEELKNYKSSIREFSANTGTCYEVTEYYVEEAEYDEDGDWIAGGDIWGFSKMEIEVVEKPSYNTLAIFNNMKDAEEAADNYEGDDEVYLSF